MDRTGPIWIKMAKLNRIRLKQTKWTEMDQIRPNQPNWTELDRHEGLLSLSLKVYENDI